MSLSTAIAALKTTVAGVSGIRACLIGQPNNAHHLPLAFIEIDSASRTYAAQIVGNVYRVRLSVCVARQGNTVAETDLMPFLTSVPVAIDADLTLGGTVNTTRVTDWSADYFSFGEPEVMTRRVVFLVEMTHKGARGTV